MTIACYQAETHKVFSFSDCFAASTNILPTFATTDRGESWKGNSPLPWRRELARPRLGGEGEKVLGPTQRDCTETKPIGDIL